MRGQRTIASRSESGAAPASTCSRALLDQLRRRSRRARARRLDPHAVNVRSVIQFGLPSPSVATTEPRASACSMILSNPGSSTSAGAVTRCGDHATASSCTHHDSAVATASSCAHHDSAICYRLRSAGAVAAPLRTATSSTLAIRMSGSLIRAPPRSGRRGRSVDVSVPVGSSETWLWPDARPERSARGDLHSRSRGYQQRHAHQNAGAE